MVKKKSKDKIAKPKTEPKAKSRSTNKKENKKNDKQTLVYVVSLIGIIVVAAFLLIGTMKEKPPVVIEPENPNISTYGTFVFEKVDSIWKTELVIQDTFEGWERTYTFLFHYNPYEVENITTMKNSRGESVSPNLFLNANRIYITTDPEYPAQVVLGGVEVAKIISQIYKKEVKSAVTRVDNRTEAEVITCDNIGPGIRVIHLKLGDKTEIYSDNGCIVIEGKTPEDVVKASTRLAFEMLKIL